MAALQGIGILLIIIAIIAFIIYLVNNSKAGKIRSVPFRKPSEIAQQGMGAADAKQMVSCEGQMTGQPIYAPMSGQPCVFYEIEVTRHYHEMKVNSDGSTSKVTGSKSVMDQKQGTVFQLHDGQGAIGIDCTKPPSTDLKTTHSSKVNIGMIVPNEIQFGHMRVQTGSLAAAIAGAILGNNEVTDAYEGREKIVPFVQGQNYYALGKLAQGPMGLAIGEAGWSSLLLSDKGREATLGTAVKYAKIALIAGIVTIVLGSITTALGFILAPAEDTKASTAASASASASAPPADSAAPPADSAAPADSNAAAPPAGPAPKPGPATKPTAAPKVTPPPVTTSTGRSIRPRPRR